MTSILDLAGSRRGHFVMESGYHSALWFDLEGLFTDEAGIDPFVGRLASQLEPYDVEVVCGPETGGARLAALLAEKLACEFAFTELVSADSTGLFNARYVLPAAFGSGLRDKRVALVDDVMSAGSSLRATLAEVESNGARPIVIGALHVLGGAGVDFFLQRGLPVETTGRGAFEMWPPDRCPLCAAGVPLEHVSATR